MTVRSRRSLVAAALLAAGLLVVVAVRSRGVVVERDGEGGIISSGGVGHGYLNGKDNTEVGGIWTSGGETLCRTAEDVVARIVSIEPVKVVGEVRVEAIKVRSAYRPPPDEEGDPLVHLFNGPGLGPPNARAPAGFLVPSDCDRGEPLGEILTTLRKTGPGGGWLKGLAVTYRWEDRLHRFVIPWTFALCGTKTPICD
jgi:hypothetical protein